MKIKDYIRGDTRPVLIYCYQSDGVTPLDITGATVYFTLNSSSSPTDDTSAALSKSTTTHTAPTLGQTKITINSADTQNLTPGDYNYDVQIRDSTGNITSLKQDVFTINPDITRTNV